MTGRAVVQVAAAAMAILGGALLLYGWWKTRDAATMFHGGGALLFGAAVLSEAWGLSEFGHTIAIFVAGAMIWYSVHLSWKRRREDLIRPSSERDSDP